MSNLLPPYAKKDITAEYWTRVVSVWVILWAVCLGIGAVLLWPTYVLLSGSNDAYAESANAASERTNEYQQLSQVMVSASKKAEEIVRITDRKPVSEIISDIFSAVTTANINVTSVTVQRDGTSVSPLTVTGVAGDRLSLASFRDNLEAIPYVTGVELPIDNLAQNVDIAFSLVIEIDTASL